MTRQNLVLVVAAVALSGCASMDGSASNVTVSDPSASLQNAVYVPGGDIAAVRRTSADNATTMPGESKAMRFYWFLGGR